MTFLMLGIEPTKRIELPLWANITLLVVVLAVLGHCVWGLCSEAYKHVTKKGTK